MSNKTFCDCCKKEMNNLSEAGHLTVIKKMLLETQPNIERKELDLCDICVNRVWSLLEEIKKEKTK